MLYMLKVSVIQIYLIGFIKTSNIEYYDIQYAAVETNCWFYIRAIFRIWSSFRRSSNRRLDLVQTCPDQKRAQGSLVWYTSLNRLQKSFNRVLLSISNLSMKIIAKFSWYESATDVWIVGAWTISIRRFIHIVNVGLDQWYWSCQISGNFL